MPTAVLCGSAAYANRTMATKTQSKGIRHRIGDGIRQLAEMEEPEGGIVLALQHETFTAMNTLMLSFLCLGFFTGRIADEALIGVGLAVFLFWLRYLLLAIHKAAKIAVSKGVVST